MFRFFLILTTLLPALPAVALDTAALIDDASSRSLLEKRCIEDERIGFVAVPFEQAVQLLNNRALPRLLEEQQHKIGGIPDFNLEQTDSRRYRYINEDGDPTDLQVLYRNRTDAHTYDFVVHGEGRRYFGRFEVIVHLQILHAGDTGVVYRARIHAYPDRATIRFLARRIDAIQDNFRKNTDMLLQLAKGWIADNNCQTRLSLPLAIP